MSAEAASAQAPAPTTESAATPTQVVLGTDNMWQLLGYFLNLAQQRGGFLLPEAAQVHAAVSALPQEAAKNAAIEAVHVAQSRGAYSLQEADGLNKVVEFIQTSTANPRKSLESIGEDTCEDAGEEDVAESVETEVA